MHLLLLKKWLSNTSPFHGDVLGNHTSRARSPSELSREMPRSLEIRKSRRVSTGKMQSKWINKMLMQPNIFMERVIITHCLKPRFFKPSKRKPSRWFKNYSHCLVFIKIQSLKCIKMTRPGLWTRAWQTTVRVPGEAAAGAQGWGTGWSTERRGSSRKARDASAALGGLCHLPRVLRCAGTMQSHPSRRARHCSVCRRQPSQVATVQFSFEQTPYGGTVCSGFN